MGSTPSSASRAALSSKCHVRGTPSPSGAVTSLDQLASSPGSPAGGSVAANR
nr:hypothetical protein [Subtercola vilae]